MHIEFRKLLLLVYYSVLYIYVYPVLNSLYVQTNEYCSLE